MTHTEPSYTPDHDVQDGDWFYVAKGSHLTRPVIMETQAMRQAFPNGWPALVVGWHYRPGLNQEAHAR